MLALWGSSLPHVGGLTLQKVLVVATNTLSEKLVVEVGGCFWSWVSGPMSAFSLSPWYPSKALCLICEMRILMTK